MGSDQNNASAGNRTRINCLEGSYADHYTTDACWTDNVDIKLKFFNSIEHLVQSHENQSQFT